MARLYQDGFEFNSLSNSGNLNSWTTISATGLSVTAGSARSGSYGLRVSSMTSGTVACVLYKYSGSILNGPLYARGYLNLQTAPSANNTIMNFGGSSLVNTTVRCSIALTSSSTLVLLNDAGGQIGSASAVLSTNQWYRIELKTDTTAASGSRIIEAKLDGTVFATSSAQSQGGSFACTFGGNLAAEAQTAGEWWWDDIAINDATGSVQNTYPGSGKIIHLRPNAAGDTNGFATQVGGTAGSANNYTRVQEVTSDNATSYNASTAASTEDLFRCNASGLSTNDTVNTVMVGARFSNLVSADATAALQLEVMKTSGGTKQLSTVRIPNTTSWETNDNSAPRIYPLITYTDPDGATWTKTTLDTMQIGYKISTAGTSAIGISTLWTSVDYTPAPAITFRNETHSIATSTQPTGVEPTGTVQGDVLVALFEVQGSTTYTAPAGWTTIFSGTSFSGQFKYYLGYVVRGASPPNLTWSYTGSAYRELYIVGFSGCDTSNPIDASAQIPSASAANANPDPPAVTAISSAAMALAIGDNWTGSNAGGWTPPTGYTLVTNNANGNDCGISTKLLSASGTENPGAYGNVGAGGATDYWAATVTLSPPRSTVIAWFRA
ncbi:MAG TPA: hypothetical protein VLG92_00525 [Candidatus Saccharimonadia bacterium]|nr:hypothetical protein [Candidatus Saccharimonadia bacterium]